MYTSVILEIRPLERYDVVKTSPYLFLAARTLIVLSLSASVMFSQLVILDNV